MPRAQATPRPSTAGRRRRLRPSTSGRPRSRRRSATAFSPSHRRRRTWHCSRRPRGKARARDVRTAERHRAGIEQRRGLRPETGDEARRVVVVERCQHAEAGLASSRSSSKAIAVARSRSDAILAESSAARPSVGPCGRPTGRAARRGSGTCSRDAPELGGLEGRQPVTRRAG